MLRALQSATAILLLSLGGCASAQREPRACVCESAATQFPGDWIGRWKGTVHPFAAGTSGDPFTLELEIAPTHDPARHLWTMRYSGAAGEQIRAYELVTRDAARGQYAIDEKNGIVLDAQMLGASLVGWFSFDDTTLFTRYLRRDDALGAAIDFEITTTSSRASRQVFEAPSITVHPALSAQRATLRRLPAAP